MEKEVIILNEERDVSLSAYLHQEYKPVVIVIPGGAYQYCSLREGEPVALEYFKAGYNSFVLNYSINVNNTWPNPLSDYEKAYEYLLNKKEEYKLDLSKLILVGFSAGGHLAAAASTISNYKPAATILAYPALNEGIKLCNESAPSLIDKVNINTPPIFICASRSDNVVDVRNSIEFINELCKYDISFEAHFYAYGPHGYSTGKEDVVEQDLLCSRNKNWLKDSLAWLNDLLVEKKFKAHINGNYEEYYNIDCTLNKLFENEETKQIVLDSIKLEQGWNFNNSLNQTILMNTKLSDLLKQQHLSSKQIEDIETQLNKIKI